MDPDLYQSDMTFLIVTYRFFLKCHYVGMNKNQVRFILAAKVSRKCKIKKVGSQIKRPGNFETKNLVTMKKARSQIQRSGQFEQNRRRPKKGLRHFRQKFKEFLRKKIVNLSL